MDLENLRVAVDGVEHEIAELSRDDSRRPSALQGVVAARRHPRARASACDARVSPLWQPGDARRDALRLLLVEARPAGRRKLTGVNARRSRRDRRGAARA